MNYMFISIFLSIVLVVESNQIKSCKQDEDKLKCVRGFNSELIQEVHTCNNDTLKLECKIFKYQKFESINAVLSFKDNETLSKIALFNWSSIHNELNTLRNKHLNSAQVNITLNEKTQRYEANLIVKNIEENVKYKLCSYSDYSDELCCEMKIHAEEEQNNLWMALLVIGVLIFIYIVVSLVFWLCPPNEVKSIEELLASLPKKHVEALTQLVSNEDLDLPDEDIIKEEVKRRKSLKVCFDNQAFDMGERDDNSDDDVALKLYLEANKLRRLSRMSQHAATLTDDTNAIRQRVKFSNQTSVIDENSNVQMHFNTSDIEDLQMKIFREKQRRDSVHPFKKTYDLTNIESSDSDD